MSNGTECYQLQNGRLRGTYQTVLCPSQNGGASTCCFEGDVCLPDGLCGISHEEDGASGFYVAMCTDKSFPSPACRKECGDLPVQDVTFDSRTNTWACCNITSMASNGKRPRDRPTSETLRADPPANLLAAAGPNAQAVVTAWPTTSAGASATAAPTISSSQNSAPSGSLPVQVGIGIGVGVVVAVAAITLVLVWCTRARRVGGPGSFFWGMRRRELGAIDDVPAGSKVAEVDDTGKPAEAAGTPKALPELDNWRLMAELDGQDQTLELGPCAASSCARRGTLLGVGEKHMLTTSKDPTPDLKQEPTAGTDGVSLHGAETASSHNTELS